MIRETKFTPGPWEKCEANSPYEDLHLSGIRGENEPIPFIICDMCSDGYGLDTQLANANLIASAPDLYAALEALIEKLCIDDDEGLIEYAEPMISARAALAKARGEVAK